MHFCPLEFCLRPRGPRLDSRKLQSNLSRSDQLCSPLGLLSTGYRG